MPKKAAAPPHTWEHRITGHADVDPRTLTPHPDNYREDDTVQDAALDGSLRTLGWLKSIIVNTTTGHVLDGHERIERAIAHEEPTVPVEYVTLPEEDEAQALVSLDPIGAMKRANRERLAYLMDQVQSDDSAVQEMLRGLREQHGIGVTLDDGELQPPSAPLKQGNLAERFLVPPFSVLDARQGYWQERKRAWLALGIQSELGRGGGINDQSEMILRLAGGFDEHPAHRMKLQSQDNGLLGESQQARSHYKAAPGHSLRPAASLGKDGKTVRGDGTGKPLARTKGSGAPGELAAAYKAQSRETALQRTGDSRLTWVAGNRPESELDDTSRKILAAGRKAHTVSTDTLMGLAGGESASHQSGTSIFDPVLCEIAYRWFSPPDGSILDPFAGGSVRGIVAAKLGRAYTGVDLRPEQVAANEAQLSIIGDAIPPQWLVGDSQYLDALPIADAYDYVFTCPPYADLEQYSDDPRDLSTMDYPTFLAAYRAIVAQSMARLKDDRFACIVVGDIRDTQGYYRNFVSDTIAAFQAAGARLYNEAILVTAVGSLPLRAGIPFTASRKLGKTHQNVLVFCKGDPRRATEACGPVEVVDDEMLGQVVSV